MRHAFAALALYVALFATCEALAGGSSERVVVDRFDRDGLKYLLVVRPKLRSGDSDYSDPYMGGCPRFEIHGSYSALEGSGLRRQVTKTEHSGALDYLDVAATPGEEIELGWMGGGFRLIDASVPCVVRSRSLRLLRIDRNRTVVISYHDAI